MRRVVNTLLSTRTQELVKLRSQNKAPRGKRLISKTGINLTEDELVLTQLQESEHQKERGQRTRSSKPSVITSTPSSMTTAPNRSRGRPRKPVAQPSQESTCKDPEIEASVRSLRSHIALADRILCGDDSDMEYD